MDLGILEAKDMRNVTQGEQAVRKGGKKKKKLVKCISKYLKVRYKKNNP